MVSENKALILNLKKKKTEKKEEEEWNKRIKTIYFHGQKNRFFCHQILQTVALSDKKLNILTFICSPIILLYSKIFSLLIFHLAVAFKTILNS